MSEDPKIVEAEGVIWAMEMCIVRGYPNVCFDSDCLALIKKLQGVSQPRGELDFMVCKIRNLEALLCECQWSFVRRHANSATDLLANIGLLCLLFLLVGLRLILDNDLK